MLLLSSLLGCGPSCETRVEGEVTLTTCEEGAGAPITVSRGPWSRSADEAPERVEVHDGSLVHLTWADREALWSATTALGFDCLEGQQGFGGQELLVEHRSVLEPTAHDGALNWPGAAVTRSLVRDGGWVVEETFTYDTGCTRQLRSPVRIGANGAVACRERSPVCGQLPFRPLDIVPEEVAPFTAEERVLAVARNHPLAVCEDGSMVVALSHLFEKTAEVVTFDADGRGRRWVVPMPGDHSGQFTEATCTAPGEFALGWQATQQNGAVVGVVDRVLLRPARYERSEFPLEDTVSFVGDGLSGFVIDDIREHTLTHVDAQGTLDRQVPIPAGHSIWSGVGRGGRTQLFMNAGRNRALFEMDHSGLRHLATTDSGGGPRVELRANAQWLGLSDGVLTAIYQDDDGVYISEGPVDGERVETPLGIPGRLENPDAPERRRWRRAELTTYQGPDGTLAVLASYSTETAVVRHLAIRHQGRWRTQKVEGISQYPHIALLPDGRVVLVGNRSEEVVMRVLSP